MTVLLAQALCARQSPGLSGAITVPGDKSVSHRALMLGAMAAGETSIKGLLEAEDVLATAKALRAMGQEIERSGAGRWRVWGRGTGGLLEPGAALDMGNAGTATRLLMGLVAGHAITATFVGDASLSRRPMGRVLDPLAMMGARWSGRAGGLLPVTLTGRAQPLAMTYRSPVASAQVKSAILLAGLMARGETTVIEQERSRDHTERMLRGFGLMVREEAVREGETPEGWAVTILGEAELTPTEIEVPADPSSAAFPLVAALIVPGSRLTIKGVGVNPLRRGLITTLQDMGARLQEARPREVAGEPIADLKIKAGPLKGIEVPAARAPSMIDEYPILAVAAAFAEGRTVMRGLKELRVKESDRLALMARGLAACGVKVEEGEDYLIVEGTGGKPVTGGAKIDVALDHRIAMSFLVLGLASRKAVTIDDGAAIATSFPGFVDLMTGLGALIAPPA